MSHAARPAAAPYHTARVTRATWTGSHNVTRNASRAGGGPPQREPAGRQMRVEHYLTVCGPETQQRTVCGVGVASRGPKWGSRTRRESLGEPTCPKSGTRPLASRAPTHTHMETSTTLRGVDAPSPTQTTVDIPHMGLWTPPHPGTVLDGTRHAPRDHCVGFSRVPFH
jgi:hypothetical protein